MQLERALVTGASGFIGRVLCKTLLQQNVQVNVIGRHVETLELPSTGQTTGQKKYKAFTVDFSQDSVSKEAFTDVQTIFHLAGVAHSGRHAPVSDETYWRVNVTATERLLQQAVEYKVPGFVYFSSVKALEPDDVYGRTKRSAEDLVLKYASQYGLQVCILRPALVYGPALKGNLKGMQDAIVKGWFPPIPETHNQRSMVSVQDLVGAAIRIAECPETSNQKCYTITDGKGYSTRQIYEVLCALSGVQVRAWSVPQWVFRWIATLLGRRDAYEKLFGSAFYPDNTLSKETEWIPKLSFFDYEQWSRGV